MALFAVAVPCLGQGTLQITFDGPPVQPPGTGKIVQEYYEAGMSFTPIDPNAPWAGFVRQGGGVTFYPENGTAYLQAGAGSTLKFVFTDNRQFSLLGVDLAEYSTVVPDGMARFIGYRPDGSTVTLDFTPDGIMDGTGPLADFQTFYFGPEWSGLTRVEVPYFGSLDNLVVAIPEPASGTLLLAGGLLLWALRGRRQHRPAGCDQRGTYRVTASDVCGGTFSQPVGTEAGLHVTGCP
jgi:hypothetical protein